MKPIFEAIQHRICELCDKKKLWLIIAATCRSGSKETIIICHECLNEMGFILGKALKPENFKD